MPTITPYVNDYSLCQQLLLMSTITPYVNDFSLCQQLLLMSTITPYVNNYCLCQRLLPMSTITLYVIQIISTESNSDIQPQMLPGTDRGHGFGMMGGRREARWQEARGTGGPLPGPLPDPTISPFAASNAAVEGGSSSGASISPSPFGTAAQPPSVGKGGPSVEPSKKASRHSHAGRCSDTLS